MALTDVTPDGKHVTFSSGGAIFVVPLTGADPLARKAIEYLRDEYSAFVGRFSPEGRLMAFVSDESERNQLWVRGFDPASGMPPAEGKWRVSRDGAEAMMAWRADGQELYYLHNDLDTGDALFMAVELSKSPSFQPGTPKLLFRIPSTPQGNAARVPAPRYWPGLSPGRSTISIFAPTGPATQEKLMVGPFGSRSGLGSVSTVTPLPRRSSIVFASAPVERQPM